MKDFAINKLKWKKIKLGEIAEDISVRVDNPSESEFERFVGLEHFVSGALKINNWATTDDLVSSTKAFKAGDILFARRNAYLRRASLVEFDGVCSGDAFVLRENHSKIIPGFLAFIVNSEKLWDYANANAAGTMSKRVKWRDLSNFEFLLPPIDQQEKLAELLWAGDDLIQKKLKEINQLRLTHSIVIDNLIFESDFKYMPIKNIAIPELKGFVDGDWIESKDQSNSGIRLIQLADIGVRSFINKSRRFISEETLNKLKCFELFAGDILIARMPDPIGRSCILPEIDFRAITAVDVCIIRPNLKLHNPKYWEYVFNTSRWFNLMNQFASGTTRSRVSKKNLEMIEMPTPTLDEQNKLVNQLKSFEIVNGFSDENLNKLKVIQYQLINSLFE